MLAVAFPGIAAGLWFDAGDPMPDLDFVAGTQLVPDPARPRVAESQAADPLFGLSFAP